MERNSLRNESQIPISEAEVGEKHRINSTRDFSAELLILGFSGSREEKPLQFGGGFLCSDLAVEGLSELQSEGAEGLILSCWVVPPTTNNPIENRGTICGVVCLSGKVGYVGYGPN